MKFFPNQVIEQRSSELLALIMPDISQQHPSARLEEIMVFEVCRQESIHSGGDGLWDQEAARSPADRDPLHLSTGQRAMPDDRDIAGSADHIHQGSLIHGLAPFHALLLLAMGVCDALNILLPMVV